MKPEIFLHIIFVSPTELKSSKSSSQKSLKPHQDKVSPCTLVFGCLCPHTAAHQMLEGGCCTAGFWIAYPYHMSHCMGSMVAKIPSYLPLQEYKQKVSTYRHTFRLARPIEIRNLCLPAAPPHITFSYKGRSGAAFRENTCVCSPGQGRTLHMMTSTAFPSHGLPPC